MKLKRRQEFNTKKNLTSQDGTRKLSKNQKWLSTTTFQVATFLDPFPSSSGRTSNNSWTLDLRSSECRIATSQCSLLRPHWIRNRHMLRDFLQKWLGLPRVDRVSCQSQLRFVQPARLSCIQVTPSGSTHTEICQCCLISGVTLWDGNSSIPPHSLEQESSFGRKVTPLMPLKKTQKTLLLLSLKYMPRLMNNY